MATTVQVSHADYMRLYSPQFNIADSKYISKPETDKRTLETSHNDGLVKERQNGHNNSYRTSVNNSKTI